MSHLDFGPPADVREKYSEAVELLEEMRLLQRAWQSMNPAGPVKRGDMFLLGAVEQMAHRGERPVTVGNLAAHMRQSAPGISQRVSALEEEGYLRRQPDQRDRRVANLVLTEKGLQLTRGQMQEFFRQMNEALATLGPHKTRRLLTLMHELAQALALVQNTGAAPGPKARANSPKEETPLV